MSLNAASRVEARMLKASSTDNPIYAGIESDALTFWQLTDRIALCDPKAEPLEHPEPVDVAIRPLTKFGPCPLCRLGINDCDCDPNLSGQARYEALCAAERNREGETK